MCISILCSINYFFHLPIFVDVITFSKQVIFVNLVVLIAIIGERAKRARHYQGCTNSSLCGIYIYMYGGTYAILVAHATHT